MRTPTSPIVSVTLIAATGAILVLNPVVGMLTAAALCLSHHLRSRPLAPTDDSATPHDTRVAPR